MSFYTDHNWFPREFFIHVLFIDFMFDKPFSINIETSLFRKNSVKLLNSFKNEDFLAKEKVFERMGSDMDKRKKQNRSHVWKIVKIHICHYRLIFFHSKFLAGVC